MHAMAVKYGNAKGNIIASSVGFCRKCMVGSGDSKYVANHSHQGNSFRGFGLEVDYVDPKSWDKEAGIASR